MTPDFLRRSGSANVKNIDFAVIHLLFPTSSDFFVLKLVEQTRDLPKPMFHSLCTMEAYPLFQRAKTVEMLDRFRMWMYLHVPEFGLNSRSSSDLKACHADLSITDIT